MDPTDETMSLRPHSFCFQEETIEGMKITIGALERTVYETEKTTQDALERLESKMDKLSEKIDNGSLTVSIKSDGVQANMKLIDVIQVLWDYPSNKIRAAESTLHRIVEAAKGVAWVFGVILGAIYLVINIFHLKP